MAVPRAARRLLSLPLRAVGEDRLRHLDVSKCEDKAAAQRAKDAAAIPDAVGIDERLLTEQVRERLLRGESIEDLIRSEGDAL